MYKRQIHGGTCGYFWRSNCGGDGTPNGYAVHKQGITPDVEVDGDNGMYELGDLTDAQLAKALEVMQEKLAEKK